MPYIREGPVLHDTLQLKSTKQLSSQQPSDSWQPINSYNGLFNGTNTFTVLPASVLLTLPVLACFVLDCIAS